ncbi:type II toxin-antitoxin system VapC family toxin [Chloroflexota bacterium]
MILYLDASALVKRYVAELGSPEVSAAISRSQVTGTVPISRAEVEAALAKAVRLQALTQEEGLASLQVFRNEWPDLVRVHVTEMVVAQAGSLAWDHGLRGYDAVHLAAASTWQGALGERVTLATFDKHLWTAAESVGLEAYPDDLPAVLETWKAACQSS